MTDISTLEHVDFGLDMNAVTPCSTEDCDAPATDQITTICPTCGSDSDVYCVQHADSIESFFARAIISLFVRCTICKQQWRVARLSDVFRRRAL